MYALGSSDNHDVGAKLLEQAVDIAGTHFFIMGAMTIVEIIDAPSGFDMVTDILSAGSNRKLFRLAP